MLSKVFARGLMVSQRSSAPRALVACQSRMFRNDFVNPYIHNPIKLTEQERQQQESKPVWERTFDFKKYMDQEGPLKVRSVQV